MTVAELRKIASKKQIKRYASLRKHDLIVEIEKATLISHPEPNAEPLIDDGDREGMDIASVDGNTPCIETTGGASENVATTTTAMVMVVNTEDPITMETLPLKIFVHPDPYRSRADQRDLMVSTESPTQSLPKQSYGFDPKSIYEYITETGDFRNPVTRAEFTSDDINALCDLLEAQEDQTRLRTSWDKREDIRKQKQNELDLSIVFEREFGQEVQDIIDVFCNPLVLHMSGPILADTVGPLFQNLEILVRQFSTLCKATCRQSLENAQVQLKDQEPFIFHEAAARVLSEHLEYLRETINDLP